MGSRSLVRIFRVVVEAEAEIEWLFQRRWFLRSLARQFGEWIAPSRGGRSDRSGWEYLADQQALNAQ
jgi:hypothetical protein